jgi:hypothetical protein
MRKFIQYLATFLVFFIIADGAIAQSTTITGNVRTATEKAGIAAVSVSVKGTSQGNLHKRQRKFFNYCYSAIARHTCIQCCWNNDAGSCSEFGLYRIARRTGNELYHGAGDRCSLHPGYLSGSLNRR